MSTGLARMSAILSGKPSSCTKILDSPLPGAPTVIW
jgi:hypothetical protein